MEYPVPENMICKFTVIFESGKVTKLTTKINKSKEELWEIIKLAIKESKPIELLNETDNGFTVINSKLIAAITVEFEDLE